VPDGPRGIDVTGNGSGQDLGNLAPGPTLRIAISAIGRFHMFDLARQMIRLGQRVDMFTGNPRTHVDPDLRPFTHTHPTLHVLDVLSHRMRLPGASRLRDLDLRSLGRWLARSVDPETTDLLDALDGPGPEAGRLMRQHGGVWVCNRGSTHILTQKELLEEEYPRWGARPPVFTAEHVDRCLAEYAEANAVVVPSTFARRSFLEHGHSAEKVLVCPYGVNLSEFHPGEKEDSAFRIVFVGQISIRKGIGYLLEAAGPLVAAKHCELWLIGLIDASAEPVLEKHRNSFEYKGARPRSALWRHYSQSSVLVLPSIEEGLAMVQAQALACGVPVIATTNTGAEDLFTDGVEGFIVPIRDVPAIRDRLQWMIANPGLRRSMAEAALHRVNSIGGWDSYGERCLNVYWNLLHGHRDAVAAARVR